MADGPTVAVLEHVTKTDVHVFVLDRRTGHRLWQWSTPIRRAFPTASASGGVVAITGSTTSTGYRARSGVRRWTIPITPASDTFALRFQDGVVSGVKGIGPRANDIRAYDAKTGRFLWTRHVTPVQHPEPTDHNFYVNNFSARRIHLLALNPRTGATRWRLETRSDGDAGPNRFVLFAGDQLLGLNPRTGSTDWRIQTDRLATIAGQSGTSAMLQSLQPNRQRLFLSYGNCLGSD